MEPFYGLLHNYYEHYYHPQTKFGAMWCFYTYLAFCWQRGEGVYTPLGRHPQGRHTPQGRHPQAHPGPLHEMATEAGGTHPTGMHSCQVGRQNAATSRRVSFTAEVEFEFSTWAWVQATAEAAFGGGLVVRSPGSVKALNQSTHNSLGTRSGSHFLFFWKHQNLCLDLNIFGFSLQEGATKIVSTVY